MGRGKGLSLWKDLPIYYCLRTEVKETVEVTIKIVSLLQKRRRGYSWYHQKSKWGPRYSQCIKGEAFLQIIQSPMSPKKTFLVTLAALTSAFVVSASDPMYWSCVHCPLLLPSIVDCIGLVPVIFTNDFVFIT